MEVFVARDRSGVAPDGTVLRPAQELAPRAFDHILYQVGNEEHHAFMVPMVRDLGGTVVLHDWTLFETSWAAHPALARGGTSGLWLAWREGGIRAARTYIEQREHWLRANSANVRPALNRSIVRGGDAFIVHERELKERILVERNALTPIATLHRATDPSVLVGEYVSFLEQCPAPRAKKKSLIKTMIEASERRRAQDARARAGDRPVSGGEASGTDFVDVS